MDIVLVHGYNVTSTKTYGVLPHRLKAAGHTIKNVYLGKYVTLDNDLTLPDLIKAFHVALIDVMGPNWQSKKFACLTHSTGGLVVRGWISTYFEKRMSKLPISHLLMLAPPTNGSRLAAVGKSRLSRIRSLWGVEPGLQILDTLELGSVYQWDLNSRWMENQIHRAPGFYPVVIIGQWIDKKLWDVIIPATYERGSDGVVRVASANLNMKKYAASPDGRTKSMEMVGIPFLVAPRTSHSHDGHGIMGSIPSRGDHPVLTAILQALAVKSAASYRALESQFARQTASLQQSETYYDGTPLDRYAQLVVRLVDTMGNPVTDYALEITDKQGKGDQLPTGFLSNNYQNSKNRDMYVYYLNFDRISAVAGGRIGLRAQSVPHSPLVAYDEFHFEGTLTDVQSILQPNQTTFVEVILRRKLNKNLFRLTSNLSQQKINRTPGPNWIE